MIDPKIPGPTDHAFHDRLVKVEDRLVKVEDRLVKVEDRLDMIDRKLEMILSVLQEHTELLKRLSVN